MGKNFAHQLTKKGSVIIPRSDVMEYVTRNDGLLNEHNIQSCFQFNATTGEYVYVNVKGSILIDVDSPRIKQQLKSDKICIDMGYSIDGDPRKDWKFTLGSTVLIIQTVALRGDLTKLKLASNECAVVTNDPNFRTCLWLNYEANGKTLHYDFTTLNSSISCWVMDEVGRKLNSYDPSALDVRITETENRVTSAEEKITVAESNITELQGKVTTNENKIEDLEDKTTGFTRNNTEGKTLFTDIIVGSNDLLVTGDVRFKGPLSVAEALTSVHDFKVTGNIEGTLKDVNGFTYEKVKRGTINDYSSWSNMVVELSGNNNKCFIKGFYTEDGISLVGSLKIFSSLKSLPISVIELETIKFINNDNNLFFIVSTIKNNNTSFNLHYRNATDANQNINGAIFNFIISCKIDMSNPNINWV